jgi:MFS superfamily sulfate permease-like transporter
MIFVVFGTLMSWVHFMGEVKGIDEPVGKVVFLLAVISIALILLVQKLDLRWIARISWIIMFCMLYYIFTVNSRYDLPVTTYKETVKHLGEGIYFTFIASIFSLLISILGNK